MSSATLLMPFLGSTTLTFPSRPLLVNTLPAPTAMPCTPGVSAIRPCALRRQLLFSSSQPRMRPGEGGAEDL